VPTEPNSLDVYQGPNSRLPFPGKKAISITVRFNAPRDIVSSAEGREAVASMAADAGRTMFDYLQTIDLDN